MLTFDRDEEELVRLLKRYSTVLNGGPERSARPSRRGRILAGPWPLAAPHTPE
jgi:hypothetical protein